ncbi:serine/arginine-rich splicing factor 2 [Clonorchis sinensis]|uniref:Serine/arginine-rich splicing factor 2 n=1 Tax=Clonorchis sinensis TaxID=79923 RepID=G7YC62_CLOSI|nr:serine/arginine-rich splicing factor 2 [Clonorchis sinensis]
MERYAKSPPRIEGMVSLKVDNLAYRTTIEDLRRVFSRYGEVGDVYIPRDPYTFESRGFAFVRYPTDREADSAIREMDGRRIDGREIRVQRAKYGRPNSRRMRYFACYSLKVAYKVWLPEVTTDGNSDEYSEDLLRMLKRFYVHLPGAHQTVESAQKLRPTENMPLTERLAKRNALASREQRNTHSRIISGQKEDSSRQEGVKTGVFRDQPPLLSERVLPVCCYWPLRETTRMTHGVPFGSWFGVNSDRIVQCGLVNAKCIECRIIDHQKYKVVRTLTLCPHRMFAAFGGLRADPVDSGSSNPMDMDYAVIRIVCRSKSGRITMSRECLGHYFPTLRTRIL